MPAFQYQAINEEGKKSTGLLEGDHARQVRKQLRDLNLVPLSIELVATNAKVKSKLQKSTQVKKQHIKLSVSELSLFTRQLATLIQAGLPLDEALTAVSEQCDKTKLRKIVLSIRSGVLEGNSLAESFAVFPDIFNNLYRSMVAAGESSGNLGMVMIRLADYTEQRHALKQKTQIALLYPSILSLVAIAVVASLLAFVVPKVIEQFSTVGQELPMATQILIWLSDSVRQYWLMALSFVILSILIFKWAINNHHFKFFIHQQLLSFPLIGKVILGVNIARFTRTLSILISSGVPLLESLKIGGRVLNNICLQEAIKVASKSVHEGSSLSSALEQTHYFPPMMLHMVANGEKTGELDKLLEKIADNQDREFNMLIAMALGLFEPLLIILMGGIVLFIVIAILLPIFELNSLV